MFTLQSEPRWIWPVEVMTPAEDGTFTTGRFRAAFRLLPPARRAELGASVEGTDELLREAVVELLDLVDDAGDPLAHSAPLLDACIGNPWVRMGLVRSYVQALEGMPLSRAAAGN
jgi:hypothetical protein